MSRARGPHGYFVGNATCPRGHVYDGVRGTQRICRTCDRENGRKRNVRKRFRYRELVYDYLATHPCLDCGEADPIVLDFDHVSGTKRSDISDLRRRHVTLRVLLEEIAKCVVRCANCHRRKTAKAQDWAKVSANGSGQR